MGRTTFNAGHDHAIIGRMTTVDDGHSHAIPVAGHQTTMNAKTGGVRHRHSILQGSPTKERPQQGPRPPKY